MQFNQQLIQTIIVIIIVLAAALFIIYKVVKKINQPVTGCTGCSSECNGCELPVLKKKIDESKKLKPNEGTSNEK